MKQFRLDRARVTDFVAHLAAQRPVYAPHRKGSRSFAFARVEDPAAVVLDYDRTLHSVKKFFLPPQERLLSFNLMDRSFRPETPAPSDAIFLGVHPYDMAAVRRLDYNFTQGHAEVNYLTRRKGAVFVGVSFEPDDWHFSGSVGIDSRDPAGCDIFLARTYDAYVLSVLTEAGAALLKGLALPEWHGSQTPSPAFQQHVYVPQDRLSKVFEDSWDHEVWAETAEKCVGCGTCNLVCPTCYCFDVEDSVDVTVTTGSRDRTWDGCMLRRFSEVAGGEVFREDTSARQRHRVYRKFKYISDETGEPWCVGCGRCTQACTAGISIVQIVNRLVNDHNRDAVVA